MIFYLGYCKWKPVYKNISIIIYFRSDIVDLFSVIIISTKYVIHVSNLIMISNYCIYCHRSGISERLHRRFIKIELFIESRIPSPTIWLQSRGYGNVRCDLWAESKLVEHANYYASKKATFLSIVLRSGGTRTTNYIIIFPYSPRHIHT